MSVLVDRFRMNVTGPFGVKFRDRPFRQVKPAAFNTPVTGVSRDSTGAALANCDTYLLRVYTGGREFVAYTLSDGSGNYTFYPTVSGPFQVLWYKAGSPDVAGASLNTLT